jgi:transglutaminase-like putative cysteine protease
MRLTVHHETAYDYPRPVTDSVNEAWLRPLTDEHQSCLSFRLTTDPPSEPRPYTDYFGNTVYHFDIHEPHTRLTIVTDAVVLTEPEDIARALANDRSPLQSPFVDGRDRWLDFLAATPLTHAGSSVRGFAKQFEGKHETVSEFLNALRGRVHDALEFVSGCTTVTTSAEEALNLGTGVCQDYTHIFLAVCRLAGIPARYISGYLCTEAGPDEPQASHAWPEALLPSTGWVGLDVANDCVVDQRYARIAIGRDYSDVPPVRGAFSGPDAAGPDVRVSVLESRQQQQ